MNIDYRCKICKRPGIAEIGESCPDEWVSALAPMLTCDRCADNRKNYLAATTSIFTLCATLDRIKLLGMNASEADAVRNRIKEGLTTATKRYASVMARIKNLPHEIWDSDFVVQLMEYPDRAGVTLSTYRKMLRHPLP